MAKDNVNVINEDDDSKEEYVITETPPEPEAEPEVAAAPEPEAEDSDDDEDERLSEADSDDEDGKAKKRELTPEEKRAQRQNRKFRRRAAIEHKERELAFLRAENEEFKRRLLSVEKRTSEFDQQAADQRLNETVNEIQTVDRIIAKAIEQGAGEDVAKALAIRDQLLDRQRQLKSLKEQVVAQKPQKQGPDPRVAAYAKEWVGANDWYDPKGNDEDSMIVQAIDKRLAAEGFNPATEDYWVELDNRVAKRLPHRYGEDTVEDAPKAKPAAKRGGPPVGGKREYAAPSTRKEVYISPERKQALIDAGVWDNAELRQRYIKRYADYDRNNSSR
jgi:hypothetical protein